MMKLIIIAVILTTIIKVSHQDLYQTKTVIKKHLPEITRSYLSPNYNFTKTSYNYHPDDLRRTFPASSWVQEPRNYRSDPHYQPPYLINYNPLHPTSTINTTSNVGGNKVVVRTSTGQLVPLTPSQHAKMHPHHTHGGDNDGSFRTHQHENDGHHGRDHATSGGNNYGSKSGTNIDRWPFTTKAPNKWIYYPTPTPRRYTTTHSAYENQLPLDFNLPIDHRHDGEEAQQHIDDHHHSKGGSSVPGSGVVTNKGGSRRTGSSGGFGRSLDPFDFDLNLGDTLDTRGIIRETIGQFKGNNDDRQTRIPRTFSQFGASSSISSSSLPPSSVVSSPKDEVKFERDMYERFQQICTEIRGKRCDSNDFISSSGQPSYAALKMSPPSEEESFASPPIEKEKDAKEKSTSPTFDPDFL